jgi:hypothetical protein
MERGNATDEIEITPEMIEAGMEILYRDPFIVTAAHSAHSI